MNQPADRVPSLDGVRGIAILAVLVCHLVAQPLAASDASYARNLIVHLLELGWAGVSLFFVLSGYLIFAGGVKQRTRSDFFSDFWRKRLLRLVPLYLVLLLSTPFAVWLFEGSSTWNQAVSHPLPGWHYATFTQNIASILHQSLGVPWLSVTWSLAVEMQFYGAACILIRFLDPTKLRLWLWILCAGSVVFRHLHQAYSPSPMLSVWFLTPCRFDCFALGGLIALGPKPETCNRGAKIFAWVLFSITLVASVLLWFGTLQKWLNLGLAARLSLAFTAHSLCSASLLWLSLANGWLARSLAIGPLVEAGKLSYFLYLFHMPIALTIYQIVSGGGILLANSTDWLCLIVIGAVLYGAAKVSYRYVESPCMGWRWRRPPVVSPKPA